MLCQLLDLNCLIIRSSLNYFCTIADINLYFVSHFSLLVDFYRFWKNLIAFDINYINSYLNIKIKWYKSRLGKYLNPISLFMSKTRWFGNNLCMNLWKSSLSYSAWVRVEKLYFGPILMRLSSTRNTKLNAIYVIMLGP